MNFLNSDGCFLTKKADACSVEEPSDAWILLEEETFEKIYQATGAGAQGTRYVYVLEGLRQKGHQLSYNSPCTPSETSRWEKVDCGSDGFTAEDSTEEVFSEILQNSLDENKFVKDVTFPAVGVSCHSRDKNRFDFKVKLKNGSCWKNVHRSHLQVYDFSAWVSKHPGGEDAITQFAFFEDKNFHAAFPSKHAMYQFDEAAETITEVGKYGDSIRFSSLPSQLTVEAVAEALNVGASRFRAGATVVCGSPFETRSYPAKAGTRYRESFAIMGLQMGLAVNFQRGQVWNTLTLDADDALRQRVAWAVSQIFAITESALRGSSLTEAWMVRCHRRLKPAPDPAPEVFLKICSCCRCTTTFSFDTRSGVIETS